MKKGVLFGIIFIVVLINLISADIRINEVELNPAGSDRGNEWIELYSDNEINLSGWKVVNNGGEEVELNFSFQGYYVIEFGKIWLDNSEERISLIDDEGGNVFETDILEDSENDERTWTYCEGDWIFMNPTKNSENNCSFLDEDGKNQNDTNNKSVNSSIYLEMNWDEGDIVNGDDFVIEIKVFNLKNKNYDVRVWTEFEENDTVISDRYDEENEEWKSGRYYVDKFFQGPGNKSEDIELRIRNDYEDFKGDARIFFKIRDEIEIEGNIEILGPEEEDVSESVKEEKVEENVSSENNLTVITRNVIQLGKTKIINETSESIKRKNDIVYESKNQLIIKYSVYFFALSCVVLTILLGWRKLE